jgi:hypothetical protein
MPPSSPASGGSACCLLGVRVGRSQQLRGLGMVGVGGGACHGGRAAAGGGDRGAPPGEPRRPAGAASGALLRWGRRASGADGGWGRGGACAIFLSGATRFGIQGGFPLSLLVLWGAHGPGLSAAGGVVVVDAGGFCPRGYGGGAAGWLAAGGAGGFPPGRAPRVCAWGRVWRGVWCWAGPFAFAGVGRSWWAGPGWSFGGLEELAAEPFDEDHMAPLHQATHQIKPSPRSPSDAPLLKWLWLPLGTLDRELGFPAAPRDIRRHRARSRSLVLSSNPTGPPSLQLVA